MGGGSQRTNPYGSSVASRPPRAVVLVPPGGTPPAVLLGALGRKGFSCCIVTDVPAVMAELASQPALAVVVCEPQRQQGVRDLAQALAVYFPDTLRWGYRSQGRGPSLQSLEASWATSSPSENRRARRDAPSPFDPRAEATRAESNEADEDPEAGGSFDSLASLVEQATEAVGGPRLRLAGSDVEAGHWRAASDSASPNSRLASQSSRIRAARLRRRLADLVHATNQADSPAASETRKGPRTPEVHPTAAATDCDDEPLISQEELAMLLGPPEPETEPEPRAASGGSPPPHGSSSD